MTSGTRSANAPSVCAIVLNYNGKNVTLETLASLTQLDYPTLEILVVDNGSEDGSQEAIAAAYPDLAQVRKEVNEGVAAGMNVGIAWALARGFEYLLILNNDIEVAPDMVTRLVDELEARPEFACAGPKCFYYWDRERLWSAGGRLAYREAITRERGMGEIDGGRYDATEEVDYINGCAILIPRPVIEAVGPMDPAYVVGVEDADWCARAKEKGYKCLYVADAVLWHMVSHTTGGYKPRKTFQTGRSTAIFVRRHGSGWQRLRFRLLVALAMPFAYLRELARGNQAAVLAKVRGYREGWNVELPPVPIIDDLATDASPCRRAGVENTSGAVDDSYTRS